MRIKAGLVAVLSIAALAAAGQPALLAAQASGTMNPALFDALSYRMVGPTRGGRVTAVAGHRAQPSTFYMGASGGGVWKTEDYGQSWRPISDGYFATGSIGAIAVADSDPNILYVATGSDGLRSNVIIGKGVYKSTDAGRTWEHVGLENTGNSGAVLIHPTNPDIAYVAAIGNPFAPNPERGVYRTRDGGDTWEQVLFVSDKTGAVDLEFAPDNPDEIYASMWLAERKPWTIISGGYEGGVYKSSDGGDTWQQLQNGLPNGLRGKSDLAVSAGDPDRVYVLIEAPPGEGGVYRSDDRGATWYQTSDYQPIQNRPFYYCNLVAHPTNPDILWGMAESYSRSDDGGYTWGSGGRTPHGDNHDLWINPDDPDIMIQSNDGGANVTRDGGRTWSTQNNQATAELYQVDVSTGYPRRLYAGQQDSSTISVPSFPDRSAPGGPEALWETQGGCETGPAVPKPGDPDIVYADCKGRFGVYNRRTGQEQQYYVGFQNLYTSPEELVYRFQRVSPIHVSPHDPNRVYHTSQFVHVTEDNGVTWDTISPDLTAHTPETQVQSGSPITVDSTGEEHFSVIYEIQESPLERGVIWVGANDGPIHLTRDNGETWTDVTPPGIGPYGRVQTIEVSPHDPAKAYASILRYQLGDFAPYAFKTEDYGATWTRITNGIPDDYPVRVVREDPEREGLLYAGTEFGMFISFDDGANWQPFQLNLPVTPVTDLKIIDGDLYMSTMGRSFWIMDDLTPLHEITPEVAAAPAHLFSIQEAVRRRGGGRGGRGGDPTQPQYPPVGAYIDYWFSEAPAGEVTLDIYDADGNLVRGFSSRPPRGPAEVPDGLSQSEWHLERFGTQPLPADAGMHRFVWDLNYPGPWSAPRGGGRGGGFGGGGGPMVPPGTYEARLTVGDWSASERFEVALDPRVPPEGITADIVTRQAEFALEVRDTLSNARLAAYKLQQARTELEGAETDAARGLDEALRAVQSQFEDEPYRYAPIMLLGQLQYLYGNLDSADQEVPRDAVTRHEDLSATLDQLIADLERLLATMRD